MATDNLVNAKKSLLIREGIPESKLETLIGTVLSTEETNNDIKLVIRNWARSLNLDSVIWTDLSPKFLSIDKRIPTIEEALAHLNSLDINRRSSPKNISERPLSK
jgi:hypothetical protein